MLKNEYENCRRCIYSSPDERVWSSQSDKEEIILDEPEIIRQGNKYGVKIHSQAPSIHLIRANIETEIARLLEMSSRRKI